MKDQLLSAEQVSDIRERIIRGAIEQYQGSSWTGAPLPIPELILCGVYPAKGNYLVVLRNHSGELARYDCRLTWGVAPSPFAEASAILHDVEEAQNAKL